MTWAALRAYSEGGSIAAVESSFLGSLITAPYLRLGKAVCALKPEHFSSSHYGAVFEAVMRLKHPEAVLVAHDLENSGMRPPQGSYGWGTVVGAVLDDPLVDEDAAEEAALTIRAAAKRRSMETRLRAVR